MIQHAYEFSLPLVALDSETTCEGDAKSRFIVALKWARLRFRWDRLTGEMN